MFEARKVVLAFSLHVAQCMGGVLDFAMGKLKFSENEVLIGGKRCRRRKYYPNPHEQYL